MTSHELATKAYYKQGTWDVKETLGKTQIPPSQDTLAGSRGGIKKIK
jgi:hypothetical protein